MASKDDNVAGVSRFDGMTWTGYSTADGLIQDSVFDIAVDRRGRVWFATLGGISEFRPDEDPEPPVPTPTRAPGASYLPRTDRP